MTIFKASALLLRKETLRVKLTVFWRMPDDVSVQYSLTFTYCNWLRIRVAQHYMSSIVRDNDNDNDNNNNGKTLNPTVSFKYIQHALQ